MGSHCAASPQELRELGLRTTARLPRIWWVTSGLAGLCPLHAAGLGWGQLDENTASQVVSSYTPTFKALAFSTEKSSKTSPWKLQRASIVSMPETTGWTDLDVSKEVNEVKSALEKLGVQVKEPLASPAKSEVLAEMITSNILHFACHRESDPVDPSNSGLYFRDDEASEPEKMNVQELSTIALEGTQMVYVSACSTAKNASEALIDEMIHIASAFQLVGFPHVIGTLWEADDDAAREVASTFYICLMDEDQKGTAKEDLFAYALREATAHIREGRVSGGRYNKNAAKNALAWAPFIHLGC